MDESQALDAFAALGEATRLQILRFLVRSGPEGAPAGEVSKTVGAISSRTSFHLAILTRAGLISAEKKGRQVIYRADFAALAGLVGYLVEDCCGGNAEVAACCS